MADTTRRRRGVGFLRRLRSYAGRTPAAHWVQRTAPVRRVRRLRMGSRTIPVSAAYGFDRGTPVDRYYINGFLMRFAGFHGYAQGCIGGRVLEIGGREYADRFAAPGSRIEVLHENAANAEATIVGDLMDPGALEPDAYDCILCTQTLPVLWDVPAALRTMHAGLKPGGVLLVTVPGITKALLPDRDHWGDWWRFTAGSMRRLCAEAFPGGSVAVETYGNLLSATMFLHGYAAEELTAADLDLRDPDFEVTIAVRAVKSDRA
jgi:SAM-dependent methyltransferase